MIQREQTRNGRVLKFSKLSPFPSKKKATPPKLPSARDQAFKCPRFCGKFLFHVITILMEQLVKKGTGNELQALTVSQQALMRTKHYVPDTRRLSFSSVWTFRGMAYGATSA